MKTYPIAIGIVKLKDKILILKRSKTRRCSPNLWEFASGFIKEGESAEETILREVKEETSLKGKL